MDKCHARHTAKKKNQINAEHISHCRNIHADSLVIIMAAKHDNNH